MLRGFLLNTSETTTQRGFRILKKDSRISSSQSLKRGGKVDFC